MGFAFNYALNLASIAVGRQPTRPLLFSYYVTHRCDLNCRYCCDGEGKRFNEDRVPELSTGEAKRLLAILRQATDTLDITGGEPMMRGDLEEILMHARQLGFRTILNTKGMGLEKRPDLVRYSSVLVLSLDTLDPVLLAELLGRPRERAEQVLAGLRFALAKRRETGTRLVLSAVATPSNTGEVAEVLRFVLEHGISFQVSPEIVGTIPNPDIRASERYRKLMNDVIAAKRTRRGVLGIMAYLEGIRDFASFRCHPLLMPIIRPDGRMYYPCLESKHAEVNLLEFGSYAESLRQARRRYGKIPDCRDCCHIFCHMALSLLQRHPVAALAESRHLGSN